MEIRVTLSLLDIKGVTQQKNKRIPELKFILEGKKPLNEVLFNGIQPVKKASLRYQLYLEIFSLESFGEEM